MQRLLILVTFAVLGAASGGCINQYSSDRNVRTDQLLSQSEGLRQSAKESDRLWMNDQPAHMSYERVHGGIGP